MWICNWLLPDRNAQCPRLEDLGTNKASESVPSSPRFRKIGAIQLDFSQSDLLDLVQPSLNILNFTSQVLAD